MIKRRMAAPIKEFPKYKIDKQGNIYNSSGLRLKPEATRNGYLRVSLSNETIKHKRLSVHRLVAETFIPNPKRLPQVNHIDEDRTNNDVKNLEWCTPLENLRHSKVIEKASVAKEHKVKRLSDGKVFNSIKEAASDSGVHHSNIVACCNGRRNKCGGSKWQYV